MPRRRSGPRLVTRKGKSSYFIRFIDIDGKQKELSTGTQVSEQAEEVLEEFLRARRGIGKAREHRHVEIAEVLADYAEHISDNESAAMRAAYAMSHLLPFWEAKTIDHVNIETLKKYRLAASRSVSTVRRELSVLRAAINHAVAMNRIVPFGEIELPKGAKPRKRWLTRSEVALLLRTARKEYRTSYNLCLFILLAVYSGARKTAVMELEWNQIDFEKRMLDFNKPGVEESNKRRACIPIGRKLLSLLARRYKLSDGQCSYVFHEKENKSRRVLSISKGFRSTARKSGLMDVTPHTLRHTCASWMAQRGEKMIDASVYLNMSMETLSHIYAHHDNAHIRELADRF
jgi:integrase